MKAKICLSIILCLTVASVAVAQLPPKAQLAGKIVDFSQARSLPYQQSYRTIFENVIFDNQHYAMVVDWKNVKFEPVDLYPLVTKEIPRWNGDWTGIPPVLTDPRGDAEPVPGTNQPLPGTDFTALYMARDDEKLYLKLDLDDFPAYLCTYSITFRQYLHQANTPGDLTAEAGAQLIDETWQGGAAVWGSAGPTGVRIYGGVDVQAGYKYLQFSVPIASLHYTPAAFNPPYPLEPQGIENRFITVTVWGEEGSGAFGGRDSGPDFPNLPMIVNFEPKQ